MVVEVLTTVKVKLDEMASLVEEMTTVSIICLSTSYGNKNEDKIVEIKSIFMKVQTRIDLKASVEQFFCPTQWFSILDQTSNRYKMKEMIGSGIFIEKGEEIYSFESGGASATPPNGRTRVRMYQKKKVPPLRSHGQQLYVLWH